MSLRNGTHERQLKKNRTGFLNFFLFRIGQNNNQSRMSKDMFASIRSGKACDLQGLLEILNSNNDVDIQIKLISILSASIMLNVANIDLIITYNPLYDKMCNTLANCPPRKITVVLNFLSALLYIDQESSPKKQSLVMYVRNMLRSSGCLATMCELFTSSMMCIQRCSPRNIEVLLVLQSLLQSHARNINLFIECNGMTLFEREFLQHDMCLQLLATIAQSSSDARTVIVKSNICQNLRDFLQFYGPESQLGQWATIILYHTSRDEGTVTLIRKVAYKVLPENDVKRVEKPITALLESLNTDDHNRDLECSVNTTKFFQNVMKEIAQCSGQKEFKTLQTAFPLGTMNRSHKTNYSTRPPFNISQRNKVWVSTQNINKPYSKTTAPNVKDKSVQFNETNELSFSFLRNHLHNTHVIPNFITNNRVPDNFNRTLRTKNYLKKSSVCDPHNNSKESCQTTLHPNDFNPKFASTPKKDVNETCRLRDKSLRTNSMIRRFIQRSSRNHQIKRRSGKRRVTRNFEQTKLYTEIKHRSIGGRFFDAINTSCTTLVNTVKNIFRPKSILHETKEDSTHKISKKESSSCSYSFTNYMRKRDAIMKNETTSQLSQESLVDNSKGASEVSIEMTNSCKTCNDTVALKCKLTNDGHLKRTIRKLKLGINLYGCDFKKISRTMWPNDTYMTPAVLYNLYRKLIIK